MCCTTHDYRDAQTSPAKLAELLAENEEFRCKCKFGNPCRRRMTAEDWLCDWCRGTNHELFCGENNVDSWSLGVTEFGRELPVRRRMRFPVL